MKINIRNEYINSHRKQTYIKLNSKIAYMYDEFGYLNEDEDCLFFCKDEIPSNNTLTININNVQELIEGGALINTEQKELRLNSIGNEYFIKIHKNIHQEYSLAIETPNKVILELIFCRINKKEYLEFVNKLKEFADD